MQVIEIELIDTQANIGGITLGHKVLSINQTKMDIELVEECNIDAASIRCLDDQSGDPFCFAHGAIAGLRIVCRLNCRIFGNRKLSCARQ